MNTGEKIKKLRLQKNLTQKDLADLTGLSEITIRKYESNERTPKHANAEKIGSALQVSGAWLLGYDVPMNSTLTPDDAWDIETKDFMEEVEEFSRKRMILSQQLSLLGWTFDDEDNSLPPDDENFKHYYIFKKGITSFPVSDEDFEAFLSDSQAFYEKRLQDLFNKNKVELFPNSVPKYQGLNAAHSRTDIEFTEEDRAADEAMIDDGNE